MAKCNDPAFENMLHAYELGMLSDDDRAKLEIHMIECNSCFDKSRKLKDAAEIMRDNIDSRSIIAEIVKKNESSTSLKQRFLRLLWPQSPRLFILKPVSIISLLLIILAYPVYKVAFETGGPGHPVQTLNLFPLRGIEQNIISFEPDGEVNINFVCDDAEPGISYRVTIKTHLGEQVFIQEEYSGFNKNGLGSIKLSMKLFNKGDYRFSIIDVSAKEPETKQIYYFSVE